MGKRERGENKRRRRKSRSEGVSENSKPKVKAIFTNLFN